MDGGASAERPAETTRGPVTESITATTFRTDAAFSSRLTDESKSAVRRLSRLSARSGRLSPLPYYLTISHEHRFVWFRVAKVATRTILGYFDEHAVPLDVARARTRYPTTLFEDYVKFAFVRHPVDRFLSAWQDKVVEANYFGFDARTHARMQSLEAFIEWTAGHDLADIRAVDQHLALQSRLVDLSQVDHLGRLESFDRDFARVLEAVGLPVAPAAPRNVTGTRRPTRPDLPPELHARLTGLYRLDLEVLGYAASPGQDL
jgi:hypothetical protein